MATPDTAPGTDTAIWRQHLQALKHRKKRRFTVGDFDEDEARSATAVHSTTNFGNCTQNPQKT